MCCRHLLLLCDLSFYSFKDILMNKSSFNLLQLIILFLYIRAFFMSFKKSSSISRAWRSISSNSKVPWCYSWALVGGVWVSYSVPHYLILIKSFHSRYFTRVNLHNDYSYPASLFLDPALSTREWRWNSSHLSLSTADCVSEWLPRINLIRKVNLLGEIAKYTAKPENKRDFWIRFVFLCNPEAGQMSGLFLLFHQ